MRQIIVFLVLVLLSPWWAKAQSMPECSVTSCNSTSDCPKTNSFGYVVSCFEGTCLLTSITNLGIGDECTVGSTISRCSDGLTCANFGLEDGITACQSTRSYGCACEYREECAGFLCLNNSCDAIRSIGDPCTIDDHCGSICVNGTCSLGTVGSKCNAHHSCASRYCGDDSTCQTETRPNCGASTPFGGRCDDPNALCYEGICYSTNGAVGSSCNVSVPRPSCKVSLACIGGICSTVPEGSPCTSAADCNRLQSCVCSSGSNSSQYGCYTTEGVACTVAYQNYQDCLNLCTEADAEGIPGTCAHKCSSLKSSYDCCLSALNNNAPLLNYNGTCPDVDPVDCCLSVSACSTSTGNVTSTPLPTSPPSSAPVSTDSTTGDTSNTSAASQSLPYLFLAGLLVLSSMFFG